MAPARGRRAIAALLVAAAALVACAAGQVAVAGAAGGAAPGSGPAGAAPPRTAPPRGAPAGPAAPGRGKRLAAAAGGAPNAPVAPSLPLLPDGDEEGAAAAAAPLPPAAFAASLPRCWWERQAAVAGQSVVTYDCRVRAWEAGRAATGWPQPLGAGSRGRACCAADDAHGQAPATHAGRARPPALPPPAPSTRSCGRHRWTAPLRRCPCAT
jgi:hypothetical protein